MKCTNCGANVNYLTDKCPLCDSPIDCHEYAALYPPFAPSHLPIKATFPRRTAALLILAGIIIIATICVIINAFTSPSVPWSLPLSATLLTLFLLIFHTANARFGIGNRSVIFLSALVCDVYLLGYVMGDFAFITHSLLAAPFVLVGGVLTALCLFIDSRQYHFAAVGIGFLSFIPIIVNVSLGMPHLAFSIFTAGVAVLIIILPHVANFSHLKHMYKTFFHF